MARRDIHPGPRRLAVPVIVAAVAAAPAHGQTYDIVPIEAPTATPTSATDVNNLGQVVGCYTTGVGDIHAFSWTNGVFTDLGTLSESESAAYAINDAGLIVGEVFTGTAFADRHPFTQHNGIMFELPTFRGAGIAFGVNNLGQIVGVIGPDITRWDNFIPVDLSDNPPGFGPLGAYGYSINSDGVIAGGAVDGFPFFNWTPARWTNGVGEHIGPPSTRPHEKYSINEAGFIVGRHPGFLSSARWNPGGGPLFLGIDFARDINNLNQVVGNDGGRAVMWESSVVTDLNDLLLSGSGWVLQRAEAINDVGQIVGEGLLNGVTRGFFMTRLAFQIVDPLLDPSRDPFDLDDPVVVANAQGREIVGLAADGVTRLVLRARGVPGSGTVTFELTDGAGGSFGVGRLRSVGGGEDVTTLTVPVQTLATGQHVGLAILIAPEDFVRDINDVPMTDRPINVNVTYLPDGGTPVTATRQLLLRRPPVMLLHGVWSSAPTWQWTAIQQDDQLDGDPDNDNDDIDNGGFFIVHTEDYQSTNGEKFAENVQQVRAGVELARNLMRDLGFASTQVDIAAHSMGGILARLYISEHFPQIKYHRPDNYLEGDVNRLITLATPHKGSCIANDTEAMLDALPAFIANKIKTEFAKRDHCLDCGAIEDMRVDSPIIQSMGAADVPAHAFVATGGQPVVEDVAETVAKASILVKTLRYFIPLIFQVYPAGSEHDLLVFRESAEGGLQGAGVISEIVPDDPPGSGKSAVHTNIINNNTYSIRVIELLNTPVTDTNRFAPGFPANDGGGGGRAAGGLQLPPYGDLVTGLAVTDPASGAMVAPGQPLSVTVEGTDGFVPVRILVICTFETELILEAPFTTDLDIPANAIGDLTITAMAFDADWNMAVADDVIVQVAPSALLTGIHFDPSAVSLLDFDPQEQLRLVGSFDDGVDRDVTSSDLGTVYTSFDPDIAAVDADGRVSAVGVGTVTIEADNGGLTATAQVTVLSIACVGDLDSDGVIGVPDLLALLAAWGPCPPAPETCPADIDGDDAVGPTDLAALLTAWVFCR